jgi:Domain of unknown function (DUF1906)
MPIFAGFDIDQYPGDEAMASLKALTNLSFCGYYLGPAPSHEDNGWMGKQAMLRAQGWGFLPTYVGRQIVGPGAQLDVANATAQGYADGGNAADLLVGDSWAPQSYCYLDLENGPPLGAPQRAYIVAWASQIRARGFLPGVYCSHLLADYVASAVPGARIWVVKVQTTAEHDTDYGQSFPLSDPHASGFQYAYAWQYEQNARITFTPPELVVDLSCAILADPSR